MGNLKAIVLKKNHHTFQSRDYQVLIVIQNPRLRLVDVSCEDKEDDIQNFTCD